MNGLFRRWFGGARSAPHVAMAAAQDWAKSLGYRFAPVRGTKGFVIEPVGSSGWRIEWGPSQRDYIDGAELRVRGDIGDCDDLQMLLATRTLGTALEARVFEQATEGNQTHVDDSTPEEMRWLVLYRQAPRAVLGALWERFTVLSNRPAAAMAWLDEALVDQLKASSHWLRGPTPLAVVVQRGRMALRLRADELSADLLDGVHKLAMAAMASARRVGAEVAQGRVGSERPSAWDSVADAPSQSDGRR